MKRFHHIVVSLRSRGSPIVFAVVMLIAAIHLTGCVNQVSGTPESGVNMGRLKTYYIVAEEPGEFTAAIKSEMDRRGLKNTMGPEAKMPPGTDCKVIGEEHWYWDITLYPIEVKIKFVDARGGGVLANGRSYHTSMTRKTQPYMINEIFNMVYKDVKMQYAQGSNGPAD